jgi:hypothetical protein
MRLVWYIALGIAFLAGNAFAGDVHDGLSGMESGAPRQRSEPLKIAVFEEPQRSLAEQNGCA